MPLDRSPSNRSVRVLERHRSLHGQVDRHGEVELGRAPRRSPCTSIVEPVEIGHAERGVLDVRKTWNSGDRLRSRAGWSSFDQRGEGDVLVGVGIEGHAAAPGRGARANDGSPSRRRRACTSVLTKAPIRCSLSSRLRLAIGVPTDDVGGAAVAVRSASNAASITMKGDALNVRSSRLSIPSAMCRGTGTASVRPVAALHRRAGTVGREVEARRRRRAAGASSRAGRRWHRWPSTPDANGRSRRTGTGAAASSGRSPGETGGVAARPGRDRGCRKDHWSPMMWCMLTKRM